MTANAREYSEAYSFLQMEVYRVQAKEEGIFCPLLSTLPSLLPMPLRTFQG